MHFETFLVELLLFTLLEENDWNRLGPMHSIDPISKTLLKPIY